MALHGNEGQALKLRQRSRDKRDLSVNNATTRAAGTAPEPILDLREVQREQAREQARELRKQLRK